jgi:hypothetical protein
VDAATRRRGVLLTTIPSDFAYRRQLSPVPSARFERAGDALLIFAVE